MEFMYLTCLLFSVGMLIWLKIFDMRNSVVQYINLIIIIVSNLGYFFLIRATSLEEALLAQKIAYIGGVFLPIFYFFMVTEICHIRIQRRWFVILLLIQCVFYGVVCTIGTNELFYRNVQLFMEDGISYLDKEYGPIHMFHPLTMGLYLTASFAISLYSIVNNKSVSKKGISAMVLFAALAIGVYVFEKGMDLKYEFVPIAYVILMMGALIPVYDSNLYTVYENSDIVGEKLNQSGFITFNNKGIYKGCNEFILSVFPELKDVRIGDQVENGSEELKNVMSQISRFDGHDSMPLEVFSLNGKYYDGMIYAIKNAFKMNRGYTIEIQDHTDHYTALKLTERYNEELEYEVLEKTKRIRSIQRKTVLGMATMVESRDLSTGGHIKRTSDVVEIFSKHLLEAGLGFSQEFLNLVIRSAPMHDLGKIGVDDRILRKQGRYTEDEYNEMKSHSAIGSRMVNIILKDVEEPDFVRIASNVAHYHHEKVDGTGYPAGLKGEEIPIEARIMALADVFDALVSKHYYKEAFSFDQAFSIIEESIGKHFDKELASVFLECREELEVYYKAEM